MNVFQEPSSDLFSPDSQVWPAPAGHGVADDPVGGGFVVRRSPKFQRVVRVLVGALVVFGAWVGGSVWGGLRSSVLIGGGLVELRAGDVAVDGSRVSVRLDVVDYERASRHVRLWFLLSKPGSSAPWERSVYHSETREVTLSAPSMSLEWSEDASVPSGVFEVWVVMHKLQNDGTWQHAAAIQVASSVRLLSPFSNVVRAAPPAASGSIDSVSVGAGFSSVSVQVSSSLAGLLLLADAVPSLDSWQRAPFAPFESLRVFPGTRTYSVALPDALPAGVHRLRSRLVALDDPLAGFSAQDVPVVDEVVSSATFAIEQPVAYRRLSSPFGPVMVSAARKVVSGAPAALEVTVSNLLDVSVMARVQWHLGPVGGAEPWKHSVVSTESQVFVLGPHEVRSLVLESLSALPSGTWEASAWAHYFVPASSVPVHSDALFVRDLFSVP